MNFSKQMTSLDRRFATFRKKSSFLNRLYNHLANINVKHSFHSLRKQSDLLDKANVAIEKLLEPTKELCFSTELPKIIWIYWHSGFENAPDVVKSSVESWKTMNPEYEVRCLSDDNLYSYLGFNFHDIFYASSVRCLMPTKADLLRFYLLSRYGGVWVDATTFCLSPLKHWLPDALEPCHLFNFKQKDNVTRPIEAWFIAAPKGSLIINDVLNQYIDYITKPRQLTLFITGKVVLLEKILTEQEKTKPLEPEISYRAENYGFMPYFSVAYFFYQALKNNLTEQQMAIYLRHDTDHAMTNNYALTKDTFEAFEYSYVSKQTYRGSYLKSELFEQREKVLSERLQGVLENK